MLKKVCMVAVLAAAAFALVSCAAKYADIKDVMDKLGAGIEKAATDLDKAADGKAVAAAIDVFAKTMSEQGPKMKELQKKYPELTGSAEPPKELKETVEKFTQSLSKFMASSMSKMPTYAEDPDVKKASEEMQKAMAALQ
jgi:hypothetical protein